LCDITGDSFNGDQFARLIAEADIMLFHPHDSTVFTDETQDHGIVEVALDDLLQHPVILWVNELKPEIWVGIVLGWRVAGQNRDRRTNIFEATGGRQTIPIDDGLGMFSQ
jgi:hypothetical protein